MVLHTITLFGQAANEVTDVLLQELLAA
jgi:hypothetical protein